MLDNFVQVINIGKLQVTIPAFITAVCGLILGLVCAFKIHYIFALTIPLTFFIAAYNVNCTVVGHCNLWATILTVLYLINTAIFTYVAFFGKKFRNQKI